MTDSQRSRAARIAAFCRSHPVTVGAFLVGTLGGATAAVVLPIAPESLSVTQRALGGALAGAWLAMFPIGFRLYD